MKYIIIENKIILPKDIFECLNELTSINSPLEILALHLYKWSVFKPLNNLNMNDMVFALTHGYTCEEE